MSKKVQIVLAILITIILLGVIVAIVYFVTHKTNSPTEIPTADEVREEYVKEAEDNPELTNKYSIEQVQAIEDNTNIRINRDTGNIDFTESDIISTPKDFETHYRYESDFVGHVGDRDIMINESDYSFEDYVSNVKEDMEATIIEELEDRVILTYGGYTWSLNRVPATNTTIVAMVGETDQDAIDYIKQYKLKEVG